MHTNYLPTALLPFKVADPPSYGYGFGLGSRVLMNVAESVMPGSIGEFGWAGAAKTYYWVDPREEILGLHLRQLKALVNAGVPVMTGTDSSAVGVVWGFSIHEELELFVKAGLTPYQALEASTRIPSEVMGNSQEWGTIEVGKRAEMVLLKKNPLENVSNTQKIEGVMVRGQWLSQETLQEMLDDLAAKYEVPKKIQLIIAIVLAVGGLIYIAFVIYGIRNGKRQRGWEFSWGKILRIALLVLVPVVWWFSGTQILCFLTSYARDLRTLSRSEY